MPADLKKLVAQLFLCAIATLTIACTRSDPEKESVTNARIVAESYLTQMSAGDGKSLAMLTDAATVARFDKAVQPYLEMDEPGVNSTLYFIFRHEPDEIRGWSAEKKYSTMLKYCLAETLRTKYLTTHEVQFRFLGHVKASDDELHLIYELGYEDEAGLRKQPMLITARRNEGEWRVVPPADIEALTDQVTELLTMLTLLPKLKAFEAAVEAQEATSWEELKSFREKLYPMNAFTEKMNHDRVKKLLEEQERQDSEKNDKRE